MVDIHIGLHNTRLVSRNCQEHAHTRVCPALTYSFYQCPGIMPGFIRGYGEKGPTSGQKPPGMKEALGPNTEYPEHPRVNVVHTEQHTHLNLKI